MEQSPKYTPFSKSLSLTRKSSTTEKLSELDVVTDFIRCELDSKVNDAGFLVKSTRVEACFNRFLRCEPLAYPVRSKEHTEMLWKRFLKGERKYVEMCVFEFCRSQDLVRDDMEPLFFKEPAQNSRLPKEYESVQNFAKALVATSVASEYPVDIATSGFFEWVKEMEKDVEEALTRKANEERAQAEAAKAAAEAREKERLEKEAERLREQDRDCHIVSESNGNLIIKSTRPTLDFVVCGFAEMKQDLASINLTVSLLGKTITSDEVWIGNYRDGGTYQIRKVTSPAKVMLAADWNPHTVPNLPPRDKNPDPNKQGPDLKHERTPPRLGLLSKSPDEEEGVPFGGRPPSHDSDGEDTVLYFGTPVHKQMDRGKSLISSRGGAKVRSQRQGG